jgi:hypothetical protein
VSPKLALAVAIAIAAGALSLSGSAAAPIWTAPELLAGLNSIRAELGFEPLEGNPIAVRLTAEIATRDVDDRLPETLDSQPDCAVCEVIFDRRGLSLDPRNLYTERGGSGTIGFALWRAGWSAEQNVSVFFRATALVLDPRARTFSAARTPRGMLLIAVTIDPSASFRRPVRWPTQELDPRRQLWAQFVLPPRTGGSARLVERRGSKTVVVAHPLADTVGLGGTRLVGFGLSSVLAYEHRYTARIGPVGLRVRTRAAPADFLRRSWTFVSIGEHDRRAFLGIVRRTPPLLQRIMGELDGATTVGGSGHGCFIADACENAENGRATIGFRRSLEPFVVLHELGHVVFDIGLDETGARLFRTELIRAGWDWDKRCCVKLTELFADHLAYWALGGKPPGVESYIERMIISPRRFAEFLRQNAGYRPASAVGLLKR